MFAFDDPLTLHQSQGDRNKHNNNNNNNNNNLKNKQINNC